MAPHYLAWYLWNARGKAHSTAYVRLSQLAVGTEITLADVRFFVIAADDAAYRSADVSAILGAFQFANGFWRRRPGVPLC
jgi:hypothetical protein